MTRLALLLAGASFLGCSTFYRTEFPLQGPEPLLSSTPIVHCLESLGFEDRSEDDIMPEMMREDSTLIAYWVTTAGDHGFFAHAMAQTPGSQAFVFRKTDRWAVYFVPGTKGGDLSSFFAGAFARCISLHDPTLAVEIKSDTGLDLR
jgi:hypothetical protein